MSVAIVSDNAVSTLASATGIGATSFTVPTGDGALFPSPGTLEHFLATIGPDEDNEVVRCTARSGDTVTCDALTATHAQGARVMVSPNKALFDELPRLIAVDLTLTVAPSGAMFATVPAALSWLKNKLIASDATVTIQIGDGTYSHAAPIVSDIPCADRVAIVGQNFYTRTFSSIQSGSGSAGNHLLVLNVSSTANVAVNDYVLIYSASGGTNPQYLSGCHKVTEVDSANSRITINSYHQAAVQPSGSTSGTLYVVKAILSFTGCDGMQSGAKWWKLVDKLAMVGNGAIDTAGVRSVRSPIIVSAYAGSFGPANVGIANFRFGAYAEYSPPITLHHVCLSKFPHSALYTAGGTVNANGCAVSGAVGSTFDAIYGGSGVFTTLGGRCLAGGIRSTGNYWYGGYADRYGYNYIAGATLVGNGNGTLSPAADIQGNEYALNDSA
ncbi:MAG TPA: hypothetical protein PKY50_06175 [Candidatus Competibacter sp.]|nr:hypothetical protein [Candidatus Competibacter sp.]